MAFTRAASAALLAALALPAHAAVGAEEAYTRALTECTDMTQPLQKGACYRDVANAHEKSYNDVVNDANGICLNKSRDAPLPAEGRNIIYNDCVRYTAPGGTAENGAARAMPVPENLRFMLDIATGEGMILGYKTDHLILQKRNLAAECVPGDIIGVRDAVFVQLPDFTYAPVFFNGNRLGQQLHDKYRNRIILLPEIPARLGAAATTDSAFAQAAVREPIGGYAEERKAGDKKDQCKDGSLKRFARTLSGRDRQFRIECLTDEQYKNYVAAVVSKGLENIEGMRVVPEGKIQESCYALLDVFEPRH